MASNGSRSNYNSAKDCFAYFGGLRGAALGKTAGWRSSGDDIGGGPGLRQTQEHGGWGSRPVDGQAAPLLRADTALMAILVPAGDHTVQLVYRPQSFTIGALISLVTLIRIVRVDDGFPEGNAVAKL